MEWIPESGARRIGLGLALVATIVAAPRLTHLRHAVRAPAGAQHSPGVAADAAPPVPSPTPAEAAWSVTPELPRDLFETATVRSTARRASRPGTSESQTGRAEEAPRVQILLLDPQRPLAIVAGRRVAVGDSVSGCRVLQIDAQGVLFERHGLRFTGRP